MTIRLHHGDCLPAMKQMKDNEYDLAIVDPPYGINMDGGKIGAGVLGPQAEYSKKFWDKQPPSQDYFDELLRISKNQIIWGANHFISKIPFDSSCWIVWDKQNGKNYFADCELAWCSFKTAVRKFEFRWQGMLQGNMKDKEERIHPTQKPVALYQWILSNYAKPGDRIIDTHLGSGSIAIACHDNKFHLDAWELDEEYYMKAKSRLEAHQQQLQLF